MAACKSKSRYGDDGTRLEGADTIGDVDSKLGKGFFSGFKWGTEVDVGPAKKADKRAKKGAVPFGDNSDRRLGGNNAYRDIESARLAGSVDEGQRIRKQRLEAYINSDEAPADKTFGKIISGSLILVLIALLSGVVAYYGIDGLLDIGGGRSG